MSFSLGGLSTSSPGLSFGDTAGAANVDGSIDSSSSTDETGSMTMFKASDFSSLITQAQQKLQQKIGAQNLLSGANSPSGVNGSIFSEFSKTGKDSEIESTTKTIFALLNDPTVATQLKISGAELDSVKAIQAELGKQSKGLSDSIATLNKSISSLSDSQSMSLDQKDMLDARLTTLKSRTRKINVSSLLALESTLQPEQLNGLLTLMSRQQSAPSAGTIDFSPTLPAPTMPNS